MSAYATESQMRGQEIPQQYRAKITDRNAIARTSTQRKNNQLKDSERLRLGDCLKIIIKGGQDRYFVAAVAGEFALIDTKLNQKAVYEWPQGFEVAEIQAMIVAFFAAPAHRVDERLWVV
jgi:hypothetical protein